MLDAVVSIVAATLPLASAAAIWRGRIRFPRAQRLFALVTLGTAGFFLGHGHWT